MSPTLKRLTELEPPPPSPVAPGSPAAWETVESRLGLRLPQDYKDYIGLYGAGQWADFFGIMDPFYRWKHPQAPDFYSWIPMRLEGLDEMHRQYPEHIAPFHRHPAPNGLFPFAYDDNGGTLCWQVSGEPDSWRIICLDGKLSERYDQFDMTLTGFLSSLLSKEIFPRTFPPDFFPTPRPAFKPYTTQ